MKQTQNDEELKQQQGEKTSTDQKAPGSEQNNESSEGRADDLKTTEDAIDYRAELEKAKADSKNYREGMLAAKEKIKKMELDQKSSRHDSQVDEVDLQERASKAVREELDKFKTGLVEDKINEIISVLSNNLDERNLIRFHYENTIKHTGYSVQEIQSDLKKAQLLANEARISKNLKEINRSVHSQQSATAGTQTSSERATGDDSSREIALTPQEKAILARRGLSAKDIKSN